MRSPPCTHRPGGGHDSGSAAGRIVAGAASLVPLLDVMVFAGIFRVGE
ncbi:MAG: hypothetical protein AB9919_06525 [Geobacteraceae bacterium]